MNQLIDQTHEEKVKMYNKIPKIKLIEMLIQANKMVNILGNDLRVGTNIL